ncbi:efflux RND transporter permease subunit [Breoghania sp. L-A4]|uniref:efflux RND transporter permease subunit n=1 Tax=Breoghania sp. L-A4 TaxID=2304600 RepID=UPI000E3600B7|nr:efflux RND transporter permease subunit [Breoghania sp. L-A4]AXS40336.1 efflux RND transporter permease subunit [Breoghania sp. L-A4]
MIGALESILRRPRTVLTMMMVMLAAGALAYVSIPKEANPDIDVPVFYVSISQQGISPEDAERLLVRPMETALRSLDGLKELTAVASEGHAAVILEFSIDFDKDAALADVRDKVDEAKAELPEDADEPTITETNFSLLPTIIVTLSGTVPERTLYRHARKLKDDIETISTVREAALSGHREEQLEVVIDGMKLESYDVTQGELLSSLSQNNQLVPAGFLDTGKGRFNVKVPGLVESREDIYSLPIKQKAEGVVTLGDVAEIRRTFKDPTSFTRVNGHPAIAISVTKRIGENIIENNQAVREIVAQATKDWPDAIHIDFLLDQSDFINEIQGSLQSSILTAIFLVMIVVVAALGLRSALLIGLAIPTSFMVGFLILGGIGMTVNMMVMFGLVLTVGMLVDGAIVIVEYADRKVAEGMARREAYIRAAKLMFWPIVSSTATTLAAFLPMLLWPGVSGEFMSYLPIMVIIVLSASLITALIFLPVTGGFLGRGKASAEEVANAKRLAGEAHFDVSQVSGFTGLYVRFLKLLAGNPLGNIALLGIVVAGCFSIFMIFKDTAAGVEFFVDEEPDQTIVLVSGRGNFSSAEARDLVSEVEREVLQIPGVDNVVMTAYASGGASGGGPELGGVQDKPADVIGELNVELSDYCCRRKAVDIFAEIRERTAPLAGIKVEVRKVEGGPPTGKDVRLEIKSTDYRVLRETVGKVRAHVETMDGLRDREDDRPLPGIEWQITIDREQAGRYQADISAVGGMVQLVTNGVLIGKYRPDDSDDEVDIRVRLPEGERTLDRFDTLRLRTPTGLIPIANFVDRKPQPKVSSITRKDGLYAMSVKANVLQEQGILPDDKVKELQAWLDTQSWPEQVSMRFRGADEEQKEAGEFLGKAAMAALFLMFIILVTQFNSFYQSFLTLSTVIMSIFGVLIGLILTGQKFSIIMTGTGVVALAGIVVNNAIVLIDTYNRFRDDGIEPLEAVLKTSAQRIRPILLTTITTIAGLIPMATQVNFDFFNRVASVGGITSMWWVQLSTAVIAGLAFSTLLTLVVIPTMLVMPSVWAEMFRRWFGRKPKTAGSQPVPHAPAEIPDTGPAEAASAAVIALPAKPRTPPPGVPDAAE